jgi:hypothetical protein
LYFFGGKKVHRGGDFGMNNQEQLDLEKIDNWYSTHFEELVSKYGGKAIGVVDGKIIAVADTEKEADRLTRVAKPDAIVVVLSIPTEDEFLCLL